jgi:hypothetical protein
MAEAKGKKSAEQVPGAEGAPDAATQSQTVELGIRLVPVGNSDQPVVANYAMLNAAPGMAFIDFGFLEPGMLAALPRMARQGSKLPESINGKLAVRVAMSYEALASLHQQLGRVAAGLAQQRAASVKKDG